MKSYTLLAALALAAIASAPQVDAATVYAKFEAVTGVWNNTTGQGWFNYIGSTPYGLSSTPDLVIRAAIDNTKMDGTAFESLVYKTGTKTWRLSDIDIANSSVNYDGAGNVTQWGLVFKQSANYFYSNNTVQVNDGEGNAMFCNACVGAVQTAAVPEPAGWALMILGIGGLGGVLRSRRRAGLAAA